MGAINGILMGVYAVVLGDTFTRNVTDTHTHRLADGRPEL